MSRVGVSYFRSCSGNLSGLALCRHGCPLPLSPPLMQYAVALLFCLLPLLANALEPGDKRAL